MKLTAGIIAGLVGLILWIITVIPNMVHQFEIITAYWGW